MLLQELQAHLSANPDADIIGHESEFVAQFAKEKNIAGDINQVTHDLKTWMIKEAVRQLFDQADWLSDKDWIEGRGLEIQFAGTTIKTEVSDGMLDENATHEDVNKVIEKLVYEAVKKFSQKIGAYQ